MDRLTRNFFDDMQGIERYAAESPNIEINCGGDDYQEIIDKLAEYENAEEDGLLVRLPCKVGDRIWHLEKMINSGEWRLYGKETIVTDIYLNAKRPPLFKVTNLYGTLKLSDFGKTVFLTKEAAEAALKETRND